jgi:hypothetical protein
MPDARRPLTLLQLAIAATAAVVPVLLGVLLAVASARRGDDAEPARVSERHVSVRHVAALKTFESAIVRRDHAATPLPSPDALLERIPQCRAAWTGAPGLMARARMTLGRGVQGGPSAATRIARELVTIDQALLRFSSADNRRVTDTLGLDGARWLDAVARALASPVESPEYPGRRFSVGCDDIAGAVAALARSNARMLDVLAWRGTEVERVVERWRPDQYVEISPRQVARANPWSGIPGCIYLGHAARDSGPVYYVGNVRGLDERLCTRNEMLGSATEPAGVVRLPGEPAPDMPFGDPRWKVPPSLGALLQPLETLHRPAGPLYRDFTAPVEAGLLPATWVPSPNRIVIGGHAVDVGFSVDLTIDPDLQALAQQTAACYTGRDDICRALGMRRKEDAARPLGAALLEHAMVRMAAVAIVDVASGRIEAVAGALSPCTREEYDGPGRSRHCDRRIPYPVRYRPDALLNAAVFHDAMPASTIKPIMAAAFLSDPVVGPRWLAAEEAEMARAGNAWPSAQSLRGQLMRSDSARFLDRMFCADRGFGPCARPWEVQSEASLFGWNGGCSAPRDDCGKRDLLFGRSVDGAGDPRLRALAIEVPYGRLLAEPAGGTISAPFHLRAPLALDAAKVRRCAEGPDGRRPSRDDWEKCGGGVVVDVVAEGWGQGHARASALGSAGMMATLAAAANGEERVRLPHLVEAVRGVSHADSGSSHSAAPRLDLGETMPNRVTRDAASVILSGLAYGHRGGTSRLACEQVFEARECAQMDWIAGKTGTPTFPNDDRSLAELARLCAPGVAKTRSERAACGPLRPYKWYVAAYRTDRADPRWTKVIAVLTERNWLIDTGRIHGAGDHGPNPAAEIAMQIAGRDAGLLPWGAQ